MSFAPQRSDSVAVGSFNIYVFQPPNVAAFMSLPEGEQIGIEQDFSRPGFKLQFRRTRVVWEVRPDRVVIASPSKEDNCGTILADILDWLPVTPVTAIGHNFTFVGSATDLPRFFDKATFPPARPNVEGFAILQRTWHLALQKESVRFNLQVGISPDKVVLSSNVDFPVTDPALAPKTNFANRFFELRDESAGLFRQLLEVEIVS